MEATTYVIRYSFESKADVNGVALEFYDDYKGTDLKLMLNTLLGQQQNSEHNHNRKIRSITINEQVIV